MAEAVVLTPLGWLASPLFKTLFDKAHHHLGTGIDKKMKILQATVLPRLSLAIEKAEQSPNKEKLVDWLNRLKGAYYEAEDAIDLFEYELLKQKVKDDRKTLEQKGKNEGGTRISLPSQIVPPRLKDSLSIFSPKKIQLKGCIDKLIEIAKEANEFRDLLEDQENASCSDAHRDTSATPPISVFGREKDKNDIVCLLTKKTFNSRPVIPIIAITGRSGVGKTALAQYVYKHMVGQKHFDLCVWVHAPRKFEATHVIKSIIENIEANEHTPNNNPSKNLQPLSSQIGRMLGSKKLLLVLDDFWSDTEDIVAQWENFIGCLSSCLSSCLPESRIGLRDSKNVTGLSTHHVQLLEALQPHPNISVLTVKGFGGERFPNWLLSQNLLKHLRSLILVDCNKVEEMSSINESLPSCTRLKLRGFKNLNKMPTFPPNLTSLDITDIPQLSYFSEDDLLKKEERNQPKHEVVKQIVGYRKPEDVRLPRYFESNVMHFFLFMKHRLEGAFDDSPDLLLDEWSEILTFDPWNKDYSREQLLDAWVIFMHCHMETMFYKNEESKLVLPSSLTYLMISSCSITDDALSTCIQCLVSLSKLKLSLIQTITSLPPKEVLCSLKHLNSLTIEGCYLLSSLGGIGALTSLVELELENCPNLNISDDSLPSSLEILRFEYCSTVDVIHARNVSDVIRALDVGNLSLLKELILTGWDGHLEGLNSLTALHFLSVAHCPAINLSSPMDKYRFALKDVIVDDLKLLKLILSNETISSIDLLAIFYFQGDSSDDEVFQSLTSLKHLGFYGCKTTHLPKNLKNLASLQYLKLVDSPNLCKLEELPRNLRVLEIENCPNLICELEELPRNLREMKIKDCSTLTVKFKKGGPNFQVRFDKGYTIVTFPTEEGRYLLY